MSAIMDWTVLERLLLAQAVHKYGEDDWTQVARTLKQHPLLQGQARLEPFNQKNCSLQYYLMIEDMDNESRRQHNTAVTQDIPKVVKLARQLYFQRIDELKKAIKEDEDRFMVILSEIDDIKSGGMDQKLANDQQYSGAETTKSETVQHGVDDTVMTPVDDDAAFSQATKTPTTPGTQSTTEQPTAIRKPQVITYRSQSPVHQHAAETTPIPSINLHEVDTKTFQQSASTIDQSSNIPSTVALAPLQENPSTDLMEESSLALVKVEETAPNNKDLDMVYDRNMNVNGTEAMAMAATTTTTPTTIPTTIAPMPITTEEPPTIEVSSKRPSEDTHITMDQHQSPIEASSYKRPRLDQSPTVHHHSTYPFDHQTIGTSGAATLGEITTVDSNNEVTPMVGPAPPQLEESLSFSPQPCIPQMSSSSSSTIPPQSATIPSPPPVLTPTEPQQIPERPYLEQQYQQPGPEPLHKWILQPPPPLPPLKVASGEPSPMPEINPVKPIPEATDLSNETAPITTTATVSSSTTFDQGEDDKSWARHLMGDDGDSITESDSNTATPTTTTPTPEKRRSSSIGALKDDQRQKSWQKHISLLWRDIANHKNGTMFMNPIKEAQAPLYYDVVKRPLDLKSIRNRIKDGTIRTTIEFERDVVLMLTNSLMYNKEGTEIYQMAWEMLQDVTEQIKIFKAAYGDSAAHTRSPSVFGGNKDLHKTQASEFEHVG